MLKTVLCHLENLNKNMFEWGVFVKNFALVQAIGTFVLLLYMIILWGLPLVPALAVFDYLECYGDGQSQIITYLITAFSVVIAFLTYIHGLLLFSGLNQRLLHVRVSEGKKIAPLHSWMTVRWAVCGQLHRATWPVLSHVIPSPIANYYYRLAGAKIGKKVQINTVGLNDPGMMRIEDNVVVGGAAVINGHIVEKGQLILSPITFKKGSLIGSRATIQPGVVVGEGSVVATNALVAKWKVIPDGEVWGGLPAKCIRENSDRPESDE
tara:strand:+ start:6954 stop:7751 length:798 start_codon:yes stop_codon:yes gene_type:complete